MTSNLSQTGSVNYSETSCIFKGILEPKIKSSSIMQVIFTFIRTIRFKSKTSNVFIAKLSFYIWTNIHMHAESCSKLWEYPDR